MMLPGRAAAQFAVIDVAAIAKMTKMIQDNYQRYVMLKQIFENAKQETELIRVINQGIENTSGLLATLPIKDDGVLSDLRSIGQSASRITEIYGAVPKGPDGPMHTLHDQTVAESLKMLAPMRNYAAAQEQNAKMLTTQSRLASPKGAARMAVESNALILDGISQLIRLHGQSLKMQSEEFALRNSRDKQVSRNHNQIKQDLRRAFRQVRLGAALPRFEG